MTLLLIYLAIAIGVSFLCSILEAVLLSITPSYVEKLSNEHPKAGARLTKVRDRLDESLSSILILNTFAHTMGAAGVGSQALQIFGAHWETPIAIALTLIILYFSEIIPKTLGASFWRQLAIPASWIIGWLVKLIYPLVWTATRLTRLFNRKQNYGVTKEEIIAMASLGHKGGNLVSQESEYLSNVLSLREKITEDVLTPRTVVHMLQRNTTVSAALEISETKNFSRIPVYGIDIDDIRGKVLRTDLYEAERSGCGSDPVGNYTRSIFRISEKLPVYQLLDLFIKKHAHLFLVDDEFGQTSGVVTLEDAIETLLGREIIDESDTVTDMQELARDKYRERLREIKRQTEAENDS
jgi:CBS domain containing-hemolysin-like protein